MLRDLWQSCGVHWQCVNYNGVVQPWFILQWKALSLSMWLYKGYISQHLVTVAHVIKKQRILASKFSMHRKAQIGSEMKKRKGRQLIEYALAGIWNKFIKAGQHYANLNSQYYNFFFSNWEKVVKAHMKSFVFFVFFQAFTKERFRNWSQVIVLRGLGAFV